MTNQEVYAVPGFVLCIIMPVDSCARLSTTEVDRYWTRQLFFLYMFGCLSVCTFRGEGLETLSGESWECWLNIPSMPDWHVKVTSLLRLSDIQTGLSCFLFIAIAYQAVRLFICGNR